MFLKHNLPRIVWLISLFITSTLFIIGGMGVDVVFIQFFGVLIGVLILSLVALLKEKIKFPPGAVCFLLFLFLFLISLGWSKDVKKSFEYFYLFLGGGLFWIIFYNLKKELASRFDKLVIVLGLFFGGLFIYEAIKVGGPIFNPQFKISQVRPWSLYLPYSAYLNHNSIGDLWALVLTIVVFYIIKKPKNIFYWVLALIGTYFLAVSLSRAAYVSLAVGVSYLAKAKGWLEKYQKIFTIFIVLAAVLFLLAGFQKTTLFTRQYYVQGILGLIHNPLGVGVGNFGIISKDPVNHILGLSHFSSVAHNIILEILCGMGILGVVFVIWLVKVLIELWQDKSEKNLVYRTAFFILFTNFFFHTSYFIPTMLWLWFATLGLSQKRALR